jgi:hypothetical protein
MKQTKSKDISKILLQEWHPLKNEGSDPNELPSKSRFRAWWLCQKCAHEWQSPVYHRSNGTGCPKCKPKSAWKKHLNAIIDSRGSLGLHYPDLTLQWHPTKNGNVTPYEVTAKSNKKYWWKCLRGNDHEWEATPSNRTKGKGCPVCSGRKAALSNCLSTIRPEVAREWHPTKNGTLQPTDFTFASAIKVWWQCSKGHEWIVAISNRTSRGKSECPHCLKLVLGQRRVASLVKRDGSLTEMAPNIASQWHPTKNGTLTPSEFTVGSGYKAWWRCSKGHEWCVPISARKYYGCPKCTYQTSQLEIRIYCEIKSIFSEATWRERICGRECDVFLPSLKLAFEIDGYPWHKNREDNDRAKTDLFWTQGITLIRLRDDRLGITGGIDVFYKNKESHLKIVIRLLNFIKETFKFPEMEENKLCDYLLNNEIVNEKLFKQLLNDTWKMPEEESIAHLYPDVIQHWDYEKNSCLNPTSFSPGSEILVYWKCQQNPAHQWKGRIRDRVKSKGCPFCLGKRVSLDNALSTLYPSLVLQWDYDKNNLIPSQVTAGSSKKIWWKCSCGYSWKASVWSRVHSGNQGCLECYNKNNRGKGGIKKAILKNGSFEENSPNLAKEWHPTKNGSLLPSMLSCGSNIKVWWKCPQGSDHEWQNSIVSRIQGPTCPFCCGKKVAQENSLKICYPHLAKEWHPTRNTVSPLEVTKSSGQLIWWQCSKDHEWEARVNSRAKGRGCPFCVGKKASFDNNLAVLYPEIAKEWHNSKNFHQVSAFRSKSNEKVWWKCLRHAEHEWEASINSRTRGNGCPYCAGKKTSSFYSLAIVNPALSKEWHPKKNLPLLPTNVTPNSGKKVWWQCINGHEWEASINNRARGRGCQACRRNKHTNNHERKHG